MVRNLLCKEADVVLIPGQETKTPQAAGQLSLSVATTEAALQSPLAAARHHMSREDPTGRSQGLGKPKFFLMYYFFKSVSAEKLPGPRWTGEGPLEPVSELVSLETVAQKTHKRCRWDAVGGVHRLLPLWGHGLGRGHLPGGTPRPGPCSPCGPRPGSASGSSGRSRCRSARTCAARPAR